MERVLGESVGYLADPGMEAAPPTLQSTRLPFQTVAWLCYPRSASIFHCRCVQEHRYLRGFSVKKSHTSRSWALPGNSENALESKADAAFLAPFRSVPTAVPPRRCAGVALCDATSSLRRRL